ncbi:MULTISPECIES: hypothetical protein [unclassified Modestobacter]|uniref:hypothetical protein n=1 Tax=unclassified Modestobacter TaxID=2643866 RepID=UPI0022AA4B27|nr:MULTISPECIES: hypothetical protein [unclassified Modestobacter]MCZ2826046.1 hypothetical protein [Modestobacter sp. VKM Ac-2981]MCZ2852889.1 hypothetical protein [Modestobacter sp. VKM Ac-2982]
MTTPPKLSLPRGCSSEASHVLNVLSALLRALTVAGPGIESEAQLTADAPLMEFVRVTRQGAMRSLDYWFTPRRPGEWRPSDVLWSAAARAFPNVAGAPLRSEHVFPLNLLSKELLAAEPTIEAYARIVANRLVVAVITAKEDVRLGTAGLSRSMPAGWDGRDPFDRYRAAGLDVDTFAPRTPALNDGRADPVERSGGSQA